MRVLSLCDCFLPSALGGVEVLSYHLLKRLQARGHDVLILTSQIAQDLAGRQTYDGLDLVKIKFNEALASRHLPTIHRTKTHVSALVREFAPDVIHLNDARPSTFFFMRGGDIADLARVVTIHSPVRAPGSDGLQNRLVAEADQVICVSRAQQAEALARIPGARGKTRVVHNALPAPALAPTPLPFNPPRLLCVGRVVPEKGFDVAIRAVGQLAQQGLRLELAIAGNGSERAALEGLAGALGVSGQVRFLDWVAHDEVAALINTASVVLIPSRWEEPFGLVALQAEQMARPVIASAVGGLPEVVADGETGVLVASRDVAAWAHAIEAMLSDPAAAQRMGLAARRRARESFGFEALVLSHEQIFDQARLAARPALVSAET